MRKNLISKDIIEVNVLFLQDFLLVVLQICIDMNLFIIIIIIIILVLGSS